MVVEAGDANAVIWTKPDDWEVDPEPNMAGVFSSHSGTMAADRISGSPMAPCTFISEKIKPAVLRALLPGTAGKSSVADDLLASR